MTIFEEGVASSPVLTALNIRVRALRGRFYFERVWDVDAEDLEVIGRVTPLVSPATLLLEAEKGKNDWFHVKQGSAGKIVEVLAHDTTGTFHGLGTLNQSLQRAKGKEGRLEVEMGEGPAFIYRDTGEACTVQETLYHFFGMPIDVIAEPRMWYWYHRRPQIIEASEDREKVLVAFTTMTMDGGFGGRCLYTIKDNVWGAYTIKPNQSGSIASALDWLEKRKWQDWGR